MRQADKRSKVKLKNWSGWREGGMQKTKASQANGNNGDRAKVGRGKAEAARIKHQDSKRRQGTMMAILSVLEDTYHHSFR